MKTQFTQYLETIGIREALRMRIEEIYDFYAGICPDDIVDIFVTDYTNEDGSREYENLWFFSEKYCMEAKQFIAKDDFDMTPIQDRIVYWDLQKRDYDFKTWRERSSLYWRFRTDADVTSDLKASGNNCDYLWQMFLKYVHPNLEE